MISEEKKEKKHISYSEISDWLSCSWRHKLKWIQEIDLDEQTPYLAFGTAIHKCCDDYTKTRKLEPETFEPLFREQIKEMTWDKKWGSQEEWINDGVSILKEIPSFLDEKFPNWNYISSEQELYEVIEGKQIKFKGYIDLVIESEGVVYILDWKSSVSGWKRWKRKNFGTLLQLVLYRNFWSKKMDVQPEDIKCGFIILKRKKDDKDKHCELFKFPVKEVMVKNSLKVINNMVYSVSKQKALKNKSACLFCEYKDTKYCT